MLSCSLPFQMTNYILVINRIIKLTTSGCFKLGWYNMLVLPADE